MGEISGREGLLSLGPWGEEGGAYWAYKNKGPITQITIRYGGVIDSILIESKSSDGNLIGSSNKCGGPGGPNILTFSMDNSVELLSSIRLTYGYYAGNSQPAIGSLSFYTNLNTYEAIGNRIANFSSVYIPIEGGGFFGFHGRAGTYLNAFGMFVAPIADHKGEISGREGLISLGPWGEEGGAYWAYKNEGPITQITIRYGGVIDSFLIESRSSDGNFIGSSNRCGGPGGPNILTFSMDNSVELLSSIRLTYGYYAGNSQPAIGSLSFYTNLNTYEAIGNRIANFSSVYIPIEGGGFFGFHGRAGTYLNAFGMFVAPMVDHKRIVEDLNTEIKELKEREDGLLTNLKDLEEQNELLRERIKALEKEVLFDLRVTIKRNGESLPVVITYP